MLPKVLVFAGSIRTGSMNTRLAALAAKELLAAGADVTRISLADYPMPVYDGDLEANSGAPGNAVKLKQMFMAHQGIFIASPEYNASMTPLLKNSLDWVSRVRERGEQPLPDYGCCDLGSVNLTKYVRQPFGAKPSFDFKAFESVVRMSVRMLDNVLDVTPWPLPAQAQEAANKRRVGLGFTGLGDELVMLNLRYDTPAARAGA